MGQLKPHQTIIYESPDGGDTVYGRYEGEQERWMVGQSTKAKDRLESIKENQLWYEIRQAAKSNQGLQDALDHAIVIYNLTRHD